jgi:hypothetical protein
MIAALALRAAAPYVIAVAVAGGCFYAAYSHGVETTKTLYELRISTAAKKHADEVISWNAKVLMADRKAVDDIAALSVTYQKAIQDEKTEHDRIAADLRTGTVRLRDRLAYVEFAHAVVPTPGTSTRSSDAAKGVGLQAADAEFLLRIASEADQVSDQLRACQAVVRGDRTVMP